MLQKYKILTEISVLDIPYKNDEQFTSECEKLVTEQDEILREKGFELFECCKIHFLESSYTTNTKREMEIADAIQCLAIKDGVDLVQFENGNYGYVAYYNGVENGFEILSERKDD